MPFSSSTSTRNRFMARSWPTRSYTEEDGWCWFFGAIDHSVDELFECPWYKDFWSFKIGGEGEFPKTFLLKGQPAKGKAL